jgi:hypothetical protein
MTDPKVAAIAVDLGMQLGTDLVVRDPDELVEWTPTSADYRRVMREKGWVAVYICGPTHAIPTIFPGMEQWPVCIGTTTVPRDVKRLAQYWSWLDIVVHGLVWCESGASAKRLAQMLTDALDFRCHHLGHRYYNLPPLDCGKLLAEVAKLGRIAVFDEAERWRRLDTEVKRIRRIGAEVTAAVKQIASGRR